MATVGLYRVILGSTVGPPWDPAVNDFVFADTGSVAGANLSGIVSALHAFYNSVPSGGTNAIHDYLAEPYRSATADVEVYDITSHLDGSPHGSPTALSTFAMATSGATQAGMPADVSIELAYQSPYGDAVEFGPTDSAIPSDDHAIDEGAPATHSGKTRPRARHRGKLIIGPLNSLVRDGGTTNPSFVVGTAQVDLALAAKALQTAVKAIVPGVTEWDQWSRRDAAVRTITTAAVRSTFVTSRRRQDLGGYGTRQTF